MKALSDRAAEAARFRLSINTGKEENGKEGCARGTQEGFPAPFKSKAACRKAFFDKLTGRWEPLGFSMPAPPARAPLILAYRRASA